MDLSALAPPGATASRPVVDTGELSVGRRAEGMAPVFGTPFLVCPMEVVAGEDRPGPGGAA